MTEFLAKVTETQAPEGEGNRRHCLRGNFIFCIPIALREEEGDSYLCLYH